MKKQPNRFLYLENMSEDEQLRIEAIAEAINQVLDIREMFLPLKLKKQLRGD